MSERSKAPNQKDNRIHVEMTPAMLEKIVRLLDGNYFECPECGGTEFQRNFEEQPDHSVSLSDIHNCRDEFGRGCKWNGVWPTEETK